jgi:hypothetical protein
MVDAPVGRGTSMPVRVEVRALHSYVFQVAASKTLRAHHALGRLLVCRSTAEFATVAHEFLMHAYSVARTIERIGRMGEEDLAFAAWFATQHAKLSQHPVYLELQTDAPTIYRSRVAHGSHPPFGDELAPRRGEFFIEGLDERPALELCADYLDRATELLDDTRERLHALGIR